MRHKFYLLVVLLTTSAAAQAEHQALAEIKAQVQDLVTGLYPQEPGQQIQVQINRLDPRLKLAKCELPLTAAVLNQAQAGGNHTVAVQCQGEQPWKIYVSAQAKIMQPVIVASHSLKRGDLLSASDLSLQPMNINRLQQGFFASNSELLGQELKYNLTPGMVITPKQVTKPKIIHRGASITIKASVPGLEVKTPGIAMQDGKLGEYIQVKNQHSKRILEAKVIADSVVAVKL